MASQVDTREALVVELGTPVAEASAAAVASTMRAVVSIVEEAQKQIQSTEKLLLKARPFSEGSLEIPLDLIVVGASLAFDNHPLILQVLTILKEYVEARKLLQGKSPPMPEGGMVAVKGDFIVRDSVVNILHNSEINTIVHQAATDVEADETIRDVKILVGKDRVPLVEVSREELRYFHYDSNSPALTGANRDRPLRSTVIIHTPVLEGRAKWKLILNGHTISADIRDEEFMQRVRMGNEVFAAGDRLEVDLLIHEEYAPALATFQPKAYTVGKVYNHLKRPAEAGNALFSNPPYGRQV